ncbi:glutamate 5-kinase [Clostridium tetanomorphum]|uniref:glutamate 5-kinase n=1 Tax=Clostridium tetanomorphum TaxID=1553 RepID=UPI00044AF68F|nr:glutamate 5-kinase [Clostridium tetanomorphum]KAJ49205.1 gamma-glutamyl kinase [Clostridium tetanomorphum DSM 665]KAJ51255.1 gamma-glutamyl kinase [Clostridium tetanomorphum DSM 665]MBP1864845.1 glutamate 5-kinase [Clostridium tetanomorphum]NRS84021.1 glutamate 5-kinase [Clostridium tetanomorphum]SQB92904.1 gamma-glutamyl kinase [Clostridium tetanomorphum]
MQNLQTVQFNREEYLKNVKNIVVKVGSSTLTHENGLLNLFNIERLVRQLSDLHNRGYNIILVSSGAIGAGMGKLGLSEKPEDIAKRQAAAAIGQGTLMYIYRKIFGEHGKTVGQILLTKEDIVDEVRRYNAANTLKELLNKRVIPIVNEHDAIVMEETKVGDNDTVSAFVSELVKADLLILMSDIEGLYNCDPRNNDDAELIDFVEEITEDIVSCAGGAGSGLGTGGMATKIKAAKIVTSAGIPMLIVNGEENEVLQKIVKGETVGTWFNIAQ